MQTAAMQAVRGRQQADGDASSAARRTRFAMRIVLIFAALALLSAAISIGGKWAGRSIAMAGHSDDASLRRITIGDDVLTVPANMIRFEASRHDGAASRLDLYLRWPQMDGYSAGTSDAFNHVDGDRSILFLSFEPRMMSRDMSGRFEPIYRELIEERGRPGPGGLVVHRFSENSGYVDEVLVVADRTAGEPFTMRCLAGAAARESLAPCERDIHVGEGLSLTYRMPARLAGEWREVEARVRQAAAGFLSAAATR